MQKLFFLLLSLFMGLSIHAQTITGEWNGLLDVQGIQLRLVFHISQSGDGCSATMDSPDQGAKGIPVSAISFLSPDLKIEIQAIGMSYQAVLENDSLFTGTFHQAGQSFPLNLTRKIPEKKVLNRPQEPSQPYPYRTEEVDFTNPVDNVTLAGTLSLPKGQTGKFPAVVLISGSGPQNRDEEIFGHKPFLVLTHHLTKQGIAVLRYDDRGNGQSTGSFMSSSESDLAGDAEAAFKYLLSRSEIDSQRIGLIGHSEGGIIAPQLAAKDKRIAFIVLLAGVGIPGDKLLMMQHALITKSSGLDSADIRTAGNINRQAYDLILKYHHSDTLQHKLSAFLDKAVQGMPSSIKPPGIEDAKYATMLLQQLSIPWLLDLIRYNPLPVLKQVNCPVLALNGEKDLQVPAKANLNGIEKALREGGNNNVTTKKLPGLNHLFQEAGTGLPAEYSTIEQTFAPEALEEISIWILKQRK